MKSSVPGKRHKWLTENELVCTHLYLTYLYVTKQKQADLYNKTNVKVSDESCRYARVYFGALCVSCLMTLYCVVASVPARKQANMHETDQSGRRKGISIERSVNLSYKIG